MGFQKNEKWVCRLLWIIFGSLLNWTIFGHFKVQNENIFWGMLKSKMFFFVYLTCLIFFVCTVDAGVEPM